MDRIWIWSISFEVLLEFQTHIKEWKTEERQDVYTNLFCRHAASDHDRATLIAQLINKHQEQKEAFLKACTLARRTAETFLKYSNRSLQYFTHPNESTFRGPETKVKSK